MTLPEGDTKRANDSDNAFSLSRCPRQHAYIHTNSLSLPLCVFLCFWICFFAKERLIAAAGMLPVSLPIATYHSLPIHPPSFFFASFTYTLILYSQIAIIF
jgi:hypothetical protein